MKLKADRKVPDTIDNHTEDLTTAFDTQKNRKEFSDALSKQQQQTITIIADRYKVGCGWIDGSY